MINTCGSAGLRVKFIIVSPTRLKVLALMKRGLMFPARQIYLAPEQKIAEKIRRIMKDELGLTVSIGVSWNKIFAKFGSDYKKPDAVTCITPENYQVIIWKKPVSDLLYVGHATERKLKGIAILTIATLPGVTRRY